MTNNTAILEADVTNSVKCSTCAYKQSQQYLNSNLLSIYSTASRVGRPSHNSDEILLTELLIRLY